MPALHLGADPVHSTRTDLDTAVQHDGDLLQERIAAIDVDRPGGGPASSSA
jgi:hypothetical protein